ncbi:MAG TPA: Ig-like domain-containing protein, partial [Anaerolineae bacterium]|nr:Ig-like domain-containing protein [Anaerolineae bacterium]
MTTTYNAQSLPATLTGDANYVTNGTYNALGQPKARHLGNGAITTYEYYDDPSVWGSSLSYRLWRIDTTYSDGHSVLDYGYDAVGNINHMVYQLGVVEDVWFTYDALDRLTGTVPGGAYTASYQYSPIGNLEYKQEGTDTYNLVYDDTDHVHAVSKVNNIGQSYDDNGNMTTRIVDGVTYEQTWDVENRLQSVTVGDDVTTFTYDGDGALVKKAAPDGITYYVGNYYEEFIPPPQVATVSPADQATVTVPQPVVLIEFDRNVTCTAAPCVTVSHAGTNVSGDVAVDGHQVTFTLDENVDLQSNTTYDVSVSGLSDPDRGLEMQAP